MKLQTHDSIRGLAVVLPVIMYFLVFWVVPVFMLFYYSFTDLSVNYGTENFVGLKNFQTFFSDSVYWKSLISTCIISVFVVVFGMLFGFIVALTLNKISRAKGFFRAIWYIPGLVSMAVMSAEINIFIGYDGTFNHILNAFGIESVIWRTSIVAMYAVIIGLVVWGGLGGTALLFIAGLNSIPQDVYEAAKIDGANRRQTLLRITMPLLKPMLGFILITGFIGSFNIFEPVLLVSKGGPDSQTKVLLYRIYDTAFMNFDQGLANALSVIVFLLVFLLTMINTKITDSSLFSIKRRVKND